MKLWLILHVGSHIGGTWGPLPYDMTECQLRAAERQAYIQKMIDSGVNEAGTKLPAEVVEKIKTWRVSCEFHAERPSLGETP